MGTSASTLRMAGIVTLVGAVLSLACCAGEDEPAVEVPEYTLLDIVNQISGVRYGDVLVSSLSRDTTASHRFDVTKEIARREELGEATLYCSRDAFQANFSSSFAQEHPDALRTCLLGSLKGAQFTPGESRFP